MVNIPEFLADEPRVAKVQGGTYPARIWRLMMEPASFGQPVVDWPAAPGNPRGAVRLYLPGNECLFRSLGATTTVTTTPAPGAPPNAAPPSATPPGDTVPETTVPELQPLPSGTTIPPDNLDPKAPLPFTSLQTVILPCSGPGAVPVDDE
jgi:hypothetical protein